MVYRITVEDTGPGERTREKGVNGTTDGPRVQSEWKVRFPT
jgi:hypothetical protein